MFEKVWEGMARYETVYVMYGKLGKLWESMEMYEKVLESMGRYGKT